MRHILLFPTLVTLTACQMTVEKTFIYLDIYAEDGGFRAVASTSGERCPDATPLKGSTLEGIELDVFEDQRGQHEGTGEVNGNEYGVTRDTDSCVGDIVMGIGDVSGIADREKVTFQVTGEEKTYDISFFPFSLAPVGVSANTSLRASTLWGSTVVFTLDAPHDSYGRHPSVDINYDGALAGHTIESLEDAMDGNTLTVTFPKKDPLDGNLGPPTSITVYTNIEHDADAPFGNSDPIGAEDFYLQLQLSSYVELSIAQ